MRLSILVALASILAASALAACGADVDEGCVGGSCGGSGGGGSGGEAGAGAADTCEITVDKAGEIPCDVFAVLHDNCHSCHTDPPVNGAPIPLLTYADTQALFRPGKAVFQQMYDQLQSEASPRMPLGGTLTDAEQKTLDDWLLACAPAAEVGMGCGCPGNGCD